MKTAILTAAVILLVAAVALYVNATSPQKELNRFLNQVATLEVGKTELPDWRTRLERAHLSNWSMACDQQTCNVRWRGENKLLHKLRLAPRSVVECDVQFKNGIASGMDIWVEIDDTADASGAMYPGTGVTVHQATDSRSCNQHYSTYTKQKGQRYWGVATMDSCVLPEDRARALAITTGCLARIGGCKSPEAILPQVFGNR
jgi:hypothetical protein